MITTLSLLPGVTLRCFRDTRFKQRCLSVQFVRPMCREEASLNALLPAVLLRGSVNAPDMRSVTLRLDDLYGASMGTLVRHIGDYQTTGLYCSFISDEYTLDDDTIFAPMVAFLREILLQPVLENGVFRADYIQSEKKNLISTIEAQRNDKRAYAAQQLFAKMCPKDAYGIPRLGEISRVRAITPEGAYAHYRRVLKESPIEIFYVGELSAEAVAEQILPVFQSMERSYVNLKDQTPFTSSGGGEFTETMDVEQGKLTMGFVTPITLREEAFAAMQVCNTVLGAGMTSKLFMQVREKMSLCYDIGSAYYGSKGILGVYAGIDCSKEQTVRQEVLRQLEKMTQGEITEEEMTAAKQALISRLRSTHDTPGAIENYYATGALSGMDMIPETYIAKIEAVTARQVAEVAKTLTLDTVYFLKGVQA